MLKRLKPKKIQLILLALLLVAANFSPLIQSASAGTLSNTYLRTTRMASGNTAKMRLVFKTTASAGATALTIDMNGADSTTWSGSSGSVHAGTMAKDVATCATELSVTGLPGGSLAVSGASGHTISITSITALSANTSYCIDFTDSDAVTLPAAGEYHPTITESSGATDSTTVAVRVLAATCSGTPCDEIVVSAIVPPTFNLALDSNTDTFASNLSPSNVRVSNGRTVTVNTNAKNGWFAWASDSNTGLTSASASHTIASTTPGSGATLSTGSEGYVFGITSISQGTGGGTTSAVGAYSSNGTTTGSGLDTSIRQIASSTGTANTAVLTVKELASISPVTQPGTDYTDTITIIGAGYF